MLEMSIKADMKPITKKLTKIHKKQIPFAATNAINTTLFQIMKAEKAQMPKKLDRPTKFTTKAFKVDKAKKTTLSGNIHITPIRAKYLKYQIEGGVRSGRTGVPYTKNIKLNKYGNIPMRRKGLIKNKNQFYGTIKGIEGVWERGHHSKKGKFTTQGKSRSTSVRLLVAMESGVNYKKRFPFYEIGKGVVRSQFQKNFKRSIKRAIATAR